jgi:hypothetical protein
MTNVVDLLAHRATRGETVLHFRTAAEALSYAAEQVRDLERRADSALLLNARELDLPLSQLSAVLSECIRLHTITDHESESR